jgi:hypothetical protein
VINSNDIDGVFVLFNEVKGFLLLLRIFSRFFVKVIIKDFWYGDVPYKIFGCGIFRGFLAGFWGFLALRGFWYSKNFSTAIFQLAFFM